MTKVKTNQGAQYIVYAAGKEIYSYLTQETVISPRSFAAHGSWDSCILGGVVILNNGVENPQYWGGVGQTVDLPFESLNPEELVSWDAVGFSARIIRAFRYHLFAMDITDCRGTNRRMVWWSHPAEPGTVPVTWDPTKPEYDAGFVELSDTSGSIVDALVLRDTLQIYKDDAIYSCTYTGRQDNLIFNFRLVTDSKGLYTKNCVCDVGGRHFFVSDGDIYLYDGSNFKSIADERVKKFFFQGVNRTFFRKTYCVFYHRTGEVWLCYPGLGSTECNKALIWDTNSDVWGVREIPQANCGVFGLLDARTSPYKWSDLRGTWADWPYPPLPLEWVTWAQPVLDFALEDALILGGDRALYEVDSGNTADGEVMECYARKTQIELDDKKGWHMIQAVMVKAEGGPFRVRVGAQQNLNGPIFWSEYQTFTPATDYKLNFRTTGRLHALEFSSQGDVEWKISGYEFDYVPVGRR